VVKVVVVRGIGEWFGEKRIPFGNDNQGQRVFEGGGCPAGVVGVLGRSGFPSGMTAKGGVVRLVVVRGSVAVSGEADSLRE
jgi:hypothetical protein